MSALRPTRVRAVPLMQLAELAGARVPAGIDTSRVVTGVTLDSRAVQAGDLYAALPGARVHGADFVSAAAAAGAIAVLTDPAGAARCRSGDGAPARTEPAGPDGTVLPVLVVADPRAVLGTVAATVYGRPAQALTMIGITGTNGKTTTAYLLESALRTLGVPTGLIGTVETRIGVERIASVRTTPEAPDLHAMLAVMRERGTTAVVMEVSSHALAQHRVDGVVYDIALFTNLSQDHLDYHADMADYFDAKAQLFTPARARRGVVCVDDAWGRRLAASAAIPVTTVGTGTPQAERQPHAGPTWVVSPGATPDFALRGPDGELVLQCHLPGTFNVLNTAVAAVALADLGYAGSEITRAFAVPPLVPGRMQVVPGAPGDPRCLVDYAHTPEAVDAALAALRPGTPGRLVVVLGAGGDRDRGKRREMGAAAARWADDVIVTDDNPRSEDPAAIRAEVLDGARVEAQQRLGAPSAGPTAAPTVSSSGDGRAAHIALALALARERGIPAENTVVVLGKGHESGQDIGGVVHPFDDRDALAAALRGKRYDPGTHRPVAPEGHR